MSWWDGYGKMAKGWAASIVESWGEIWNLTHHCKLDCMLLVCNICGGWERLKKPLQDTRVGRSEYTCLLHLVQLSDPARTQMYQAASLFGGWHAPRHGPWMGVVTWTWECHVSSQIITRIWLGYWLQYFPIMSTLLLLCLHHCCLPRTGLGGGSRNGHDYESTTRSRNFGSISKLIRFLFYKVATSNKYRKVIHPT